MKRTRKNKKPVQALAYDDLRQCIASQFADPQTVPFIHDVTVWSGEPCSLAVNFTVSGRKTVARLYEIYDALDASHEP